MERKILILMVGAVLLSSCGLEEIGGDAENGGDIWLGPGSVIAGNGSSSGVGKKVWYAVGVDYPDGYDWRMDEDKGSVKCSLVVFANGVPMMKIPVGDEYEVSADPDMYRMCGDCLYTDYSTAGETVIKRNGTTLFRYDGREMILDMRVRDGLVYTLGQSRNGKGFTYRRNGEILLEKSSCSAFPRLQQSEDGLSFAFYEQIANGEETLERYYHYLAGEVCQVAVREDIKKVWDVVFHDDKVCYLASMVGSSSPVLVVGDQILLLEQQKGMQIVSCRFIPQTAGLHIEGIVSQSGNELCSGLWNGSKLMDIFPSGYTVTAICECDDSFSCVLNGPHKTSKGIIYRGGERFDVPEGYISMGGRSVSMLDGMLYVGLTSNDNGEAVVWIDNEMKPLKINGFISNLSID